MECLWAMASLAGRPVLVTGAGGFIGGHLVEQLVREGARVRTMCRYNSRNERGTLDWLDAEVTDEVEVVLGELRDVESVDAAVQGADVVLHRGAQIAIPYSYVNPRDFVEVNALGTLNVAHAALRHGVLMLFGPDLSGVTAVDLACHEGWFALQLARRGATVLGLDVRQAHVDDALLIARAMGARSFTARTFDIDEGRAQDIGVHDVTLMLGLLYHLENPVRALRLARAVTRKALFIETQVVPHMAGMVDWGSYAFQRRMIGVFGVVDELGEEHAPEAGTGGICLAPSIEALEWMLRKVGFEHVERIPPPDDGYEQHVGNKRVMFAAYPG